MKRLIGLVAVMIVTMAAGQALASSTKVCTQHNNSKGENEYIVTTTKNATKHCTQHSGDKVVERECCNSNTDISEVNVSFCEEEFDSGCPE